MKKGGEKMLEGALIGAVLGVAAGILLAPDSGKKTIKNIKKLSGNFYASLTPKLKKLKSMSEAQFNAFVDASLKQYAKAKKLTMAEQKALAREAKKSLKQIKKHLK